MKHEQQGIFSVLYEQPGPKAKRRIRVATILSLLVFVVLLMLVVVRFAQAGQLSARYWSFFLKATTWKFLGQGLLGTLKVAMIAGLVTFAMGFVLMILRLGGGRIIRTLAVTLIEFSRGTPTLLFVYFFFLFAPQFGIKLPAFWKITLPVAISAAGVVAEVLRSGVNAVAKGQIEAAYSLGMQRSHVFLKIVWPQALRFVIPSLIAEIVIVLKDTTFAYVVNYADMMQNARVLISNYDAMLSVYLVVALIYVVINALLGKVSAWLVGRTHKQTQRVSGGS